MLMPTSHGMVLVQTIPLNFQFSSFALLSMQNCLSLCRYFGTVNNVTPDSSGSTSCNIRIQFEDGTSTSYEYPCEDVEKLGMSKESLDLYPESFCVGDTVDAQWRDGGKWYRGRVANASVDGNTCDVLYYDKDVSTKVKAVSVVSIFSEYTAYMIYVLNI